LNDAANVAASSSRRWLGAMILVAAIYALVGILSGAFAREAVSNQMRVAWRLAAFVVSGIAFAAHIAYQHFRLRTSPAITAWHTSLAVALGALALAVAANVHEHFTASSHRGVLIGMLVVWPVLTGLPAFLVAWGVAAGLSLRRASR
jgi:hypothetical protein